MIGAIVDAAKLLSDSLGAEKSDGEQWPFALQIENKLNNCVLHLNTTHFSTDYDKNQEDFAPDPVIEYGEVSVTGLKILPKRVFTSEYMTTMLYDINPPGRGWVLAIYVRLALDMFNKLSPLTPAIGALVFNTTPHPNMTTAQGCAPVFANPPNQEWQPVAKSGYQQSYRIPPSNKLVRVDFSVGSQNGTVVTSFVE